MATSIAPEQSRPKWVAGCGEQSLPWGKLPEKARFGLALPEIIGCRQSCGTEVIGRSPGGSLLQVESCGGTVEKVKWLAVLLSSPF